MYFLKIENLKNRKIRKRITYIFHKSTLLQIGIYLSSPNIVSITCGLGGVHKKSTAIQGHKTASTNVSLQKSNGKFGY